MPSTITDRQRGLTTLLGVKAPVIAGSTGNIDFTALRSAGGYQPVGINFNSSAMFLSRSSDLVGNADSKLFSGSLWFAKISSSTGEGYIYQPSTGGGWVKIDPTNPTYVTISILTKDISAINLNWSVATTGIVGASTWNHLAFSIDLASTLNRYVYLNDVLISSDSQFTVYTNSAIDFTKPNHTIGTSSTGGMNAHYLSDLWLAFGQYIDLSQSSNRRLFISSGLAAANLGSSGATPTGTSPIIYLSGASSSWEINKGSGGDFVEVGGSLADAPTDPPYYYPVDGVEISTNDRVLVKNQTTPSENGIYTFSSTWTRTTDFNGEQDVTRGTLVFVAGGSSDNKKWWYVSSTGINIPGSSTISFSSSLHLLQD